jgi:hypothetical protein
MARVRHIYRLTGRRSAGEQGGQSRLCGVHGVAVSLAVEPILVAVEDEHRSGKGRGDVGEAEGERLAEGVGLAGV